MAKAYEKKMETPLKGALESRLEGDELLEVCDDEDRLQAFGEAEQAIRLQRPGCRDLVDHQYVDREGQKRHDGRQECHSGLLVGNRVTSEGYGGDHKCQ